MSKYLPLFLLLAFPLMLNAQDENLPVGMTEEEEKMLDWYSFENFSEKGITTPPESPVRTMAEWEEIQALCVTWTQYRPTLAEIIRHAKEEVEVIVICNNESVVQSQLLNTYDLPDLENITFLEAPYNSIWMRDYGPNTVYLNGIDSLATVEWIYNRPRPLDDVVPDAIGELLDIPVYSTTEEPYALVNTGGNFTADGMGTGFASKLILDENEPGNPYNVTPKNEEEIDAIMQEWMGIDRYIKMETLPYDAIHHIDMHMKLLNEETIMVGEYPAGVADGPQIEENLQYVLDNFDSPFGTPYKIVRIQMPPDGGQYPDSWGADYRTYTNSVFVNGTVLVPVYEEQFDTTALRIYRENMPGYNVVGIDCNDIIESLGALHCITRAVGVHDPLRIVHQEIPDQTDNYEDYTVDAVIQHRSGITSADVYWTTDPLLGYSSVPMTLTDAATDTWTADIPNTLADTEIFYYIEANAENGKTQVRPLVAPAGYFSFEAAFTTSTEEAVVGMTISDLVPNPAGDVTSFTLQTEENTDFRIYVTDVWGRTVQTLFDGTLSAGTQRFAADVSRLAAGIYFVRIETEKGEAVKKLSVR